MASAKKCWALPPLLVLVSSFDSASAQSLSVLTLGGAFGIGIAVGAVAVFLLGTLVALVVWARRNRKAHDFKPPPPHMRAYREGDYSVPSPKKTPYEEIDLRELQPVSPFSTDSPGAVESRPSSAYSIPQKADKLEHGFSSVRSKI